MVIIVKNLRKPGVVFTSDKLVVLGNMISGSIQQRTGGKFIALAKVKGNTLKITVKEINEETGKFVSTTKNEQTLLAGRIGSFLKSEGVSSDITVR